MIALLAAAALAWAAHSHLTRCPSTHHGHRCSLGAGHTSAAPHRHRDTAWWGWEAQ